MLNRLDQAMKTGSVPISATNAYQPLVSVIIPTYNEQEDIRRTLKALAQQNYLNKEVIIVDNASTDRTVEIVFEYVRSHQFKLVRRPVSEGVAASRNVGIMQATGEILLILNADVFPDPGFLDQIVSHYENDCDYLLVESRVANQEQLYARFIESEHHFLYDGQTSINWTEGFSCRKSAALAVGLFPDEIPGAAGEDGVFGERLDKQFRKVIDKSIVVPHVAPGNLREYWRQRLGRGRGISFRRLYLDKALTHQVGIMCGKCTVRALFDTLTIVPVALRAFRISRFSSRGQEDWLPFLWVALVEQWGETIGMWLGLSFFVSRSRRTSS